MSDSIIVALISTLVSVIVSLVVTTLKNKADLVKIQKEQEHSYAKALFEKRIECYPELFNYLSEYTKIIRNNQQNIKNLTELKKQINAWNSKHSLFFTRATAIYSSKFRYLLGSLIDSKMVKDFTNEDWENFRKLIGYFENFLKAEIGIFASKPAGNTDEFTYAYKFIDSSIDKANQFRQSQ